MPKWTTVWSIYPHAVHWSSITRSSVAVRATSVSAWEIFLRFTLTFSMVVLTIIWFYSLFLSNKSCALRYRRFAFPWFWKIQQTHPVLEYSLMLAENSGSVSTILASTWFPTGEIFPISTCWETGSMGWPRWLGLTLCHRIHAPSQFSKFSVRNFQSHTSQLSNPTNKCSWIPPFKIFL